MELMLSQKEEKALVGLLYNHLTFGTTLQVFGEAGAENDRINTLRGIFEKLLLKYDILQTLSPDELLLLGLVNHIPKEKLDMWAADENVNKHLQKRARYFLGKV
jgi:hypothetical protein